MKKKSQDRLKGQGVERFIADNRKNLRQWSDGKESSKGTF